MKKAKQGQGWFCLIKDPFFSKNAIAFYGGNHENQFDSRRISSPGFDKSVKKFFGTDSRQGLRNVIANLN